MKNKILLLLFLPLLSGCNGWLNVTPQSEVDEEDLFADGEGYRNSLNGVYSRISESDMYAQQLTWGFMDVLAQYYNFDKMNQYGAYPKAYKGDYDNNEVKGILENIWQGAYKSIANCNNLIQNIDKEDVTKFLGREGEKNMVKGEALALRAYMHFDLLRLFAPYDFTAEAEPAIPYVREAVPAIAPQLTPAKFVELALADVDDALGLLKEDPVYTGADVAGEDNGYLANRNFHLNYYAALGLKARIALYAQNKTMAYEAAHEVILAQQEKGLFPWVKLEDITTTVVNLRDRTFSSEHLFAFNATKLEDYIKTYFREISTPLTERLRPDELYEADDYRVNLYETYSGFTDVLTKFWQMDREYVSGQGYVSPKRDRMPAIRIAEMYYIAAEALKDTDMPAALGLLNTLRIHRGLTEVKNLSKEELQQELEREYYREMIGEGQVFFYHKRMNTKMIATANAVYVLPMPDDEINLGQRQ